MTRRKPNDESLDVSIDLRDEVIDDEFYKQPTKKRTRTRSNNQPRYWTDNIYQNAQPVRNNVNTGDYSEIHNQNNPRNDDYSNVNYIPRSGISNNALIGIIIVTGIVFSVFGGIYGASIFVPAVPHYIKGDYLGNAQEYISVEGGNTFSFLGTVLYWAFILFLIGGFLSGIVAIVVVVRR